MQNEDNQLINHVRQFELPKHQPLVRNKGRASGASDYLSVQHAKKELSWNV